MVDVHDPKHYWTVPKEWPDEPAFILGGGPSLRGFDPEVLKPFRVFAVNNSYQLAPWADVLYFGDRRWYEWHKTELGKFQGKYMVTRGLVGARRIWDVKILKYTGTNWSREPDCVGGRDSGHSTINLAHHFGCSPVFLLGFDMKAVQGKNNWHDAHRVVAPPTKYVNEFLPNLKEAAKAIKKWGGPKIFNCTPGSALHEWPFMSVASAIAIAKTQLLLNEERTA